MTRALVICLGTCACLLVAPRSRAGDFDRLEGDALARLVQGEGATRREGLSFADLEGLPAVLSDTRSAFFVVKTAQGNYTRVLASPAFRKPADGEGEAVPVVVLERFETFEPGKSGSRLARGAGVLLFEGFQVDFDTGQIVPPGQGGDLEFRREGNAPPALRALKTAALFSLSRPVEAAGPPASGPSPGKAVVPADFGGRFRLSADGRWSGLLEIEVAADRQVTGRFRSEANGTSYPVTGQVSAESPQKARLTIKFPRTEQEYDAFLWTEGKNVLAGSFTMLDRTFGFVAVREGTRLVPNE